MKIYSELLLLSAFHTARGFVAPQGFVSRGQTAAYSSYLDNVGGGKNTPLPAASPDASPSGPISQPVMNFMLSGTDNCNSHTLLWRPHYTQINHIHDKMKIYGKLLLLSSFHAASGFFAPQGFVSRGQTAAYSSFLDNVGGGRTAPLPAASPSGPISQPVMQSGDVQMWDELWGTLAPVRVQGGALKTWSYPSPDLERVFVDLESDGPPEGNPLRAQVELNQGPDNTPWRMDIYSGKGRLRPCKFWVETPGETNAVFIRNIGPLEFPFNAGVGTEMEEDGSDSTMVVSEDLFQMSSDYIVQGGAVRVYDLDPSVSYGKLDIYSGKGRLRPCKFWVETPGETNAVFIRNIGPLEFPFHAGVGTEMEEDGSDSTMAVSESIFQMSSDYIVQGGAVRVYDLDPSVSYAKVALRTDGRPLNASVELIQGPNAPKYTIDVYTEDGDLRPFVFIMKAPGVGNSIRIVNTGTQEFPLTAAVGPTTM
eukprot:CAMPEP_0172518334 /NCGR_PEP_ID=MMETSP1066-20121228/290754_1 /TAXON_ID=671091 /ORGANISM="Coscinodiscus wailesii, Strain CCMP2513" /LENGTH=478 /DNA_ID=CAMNT_0013300703 /DNA_START=141 /DNA_END=1578 /DNA_ORIENTATION=-